MSGSSRSERRVISREPPSREVVDRFIRALQSLGYAERPLPRRARIASSFLDWTEAKEVLWAGLTECHVRAYSKRPGHPAPSGVSYESRVLRLLLNHLRDEGITDTPAPALDASPAASLEEEYVTYLRDERGLSENSILVYRPHARALLSMLHAVGKDTSFQHLGAHQVREFLLARVAGRSVSYVFLLASALRSFLRFLYVRGKVASDLAVAVPPVRTWRAAPLPRFLSPGEVRRVLATPDRSTPTGRRDYAILLLLARLGLRAGEIATLELEDVHWRTGEIVIHGKGSTIDRLPLPAEVGSAIAVYLRRDRGVAPSRRVFVTRRPPFSGFAGPAAVGHIVRLALSRCGLCRADRRGAAHLFRHGLATRMVRHGASLAQIAQVLRHRSPSSSEIYSHVAVEALRQVAGPWPHHAGVR